MQASISKTIEKIIYIPSDFHKQDKSWNTLLTESGYLYNYPNIKEQDIEDVLKINPHLVKEWLRFSADSRSSSTWYFTKGSEGFCFVGHWPEGKEYIELNTKDEFKACAYFILKQIESSLKFLL